MPNKTIRLTAMIASLIVCGSATAQQSFDQELLQKVENDYMAMMSMTRSERHAYWQSEVNDLPKADRLEYQRAYKSLAPSFPSMPAATGTAPSNSSAPRVPGTSITYDGGVPANAIVASASQTFGNLYDVAANGAGTMTESVETTGSVTQVSFSIVGGTDNVFFSIFSNIMGTTAAVVTSASIPSTTGLNTFTPATAIAYANGPFIAGIWQNAVGALGANDTLQASTGTINGQGFHGVSINDIAATGLNTMATTSGGMAVNAIMRVSGNVLQQTVPVELMDFTIED